MNTQDFERLKKLCQENDFEIDGVMNDEGVYFIRKKDPWDGVDYFFSSWSGKIFRREHIDAIDIENHNEHLSPSTESAYIDQLKKEAFNRFGDIKEGDRFDRTPIDEKWGPNVVMEKSPFGNFHWKYDKSNDCLFIGRYGIYKSGKWATRVKDRVKGNYVKHHILWPNDDGATLGFSFSGFADKYGELPIEKLDDAGKFLAKQLEEYLNKE